MKTPFMYGVAADADHFTDREEEKKRLQMNFENGINTIIISPRRWGKTSLVNRVAENMLTNSLVQVVRIDAFSVRTPDDFYRLLATEIIRQTSTRLEEWVENAKRFLSSLFPVISVSPDPMNPVSLSIKSVSNNYSEEVLSMPERIAQAKGVHLVICIDEFQQIGELKDSLTFQKQLRSVWQHQHNVSYCLYGSKRHLLMNMFGKRSYPFYKFGDILFLERIPIAYWQEYISSRFVESGRRIDTHYIEEIYSYVNGDSSYIQQLSWLVWTRTETEVTDEVLTESQNDLLTQNHALFMEQINSLSASQIRFIKAMQAGKSVSLGHKEVIDEFELGSTANVAVLKKALQKKGIIDIEGGRVYFSDPLFSHWLRRSAPW